MVKIIARNDEKLTVTLVDKDGNEIYKVTMLCDEKNRLQLSCLQDYPDTTATLLSVIATPGFKSDESFNDVEVSLPIGCNSFNDKLRINLKTKDDEDEPLFATLRFDREEALYWTVADSIVVPLVKYLLIPFFQILPKPLTDSSLSGFRANY